MMQYTAKRTHCIRLHTSLALLTKKLCKHKISATTSVPANQESSHWEAEDQLFMDAGVLQLLLAGISATFPRCVGQESGTWP